MTEKKTKSKTKTKTKAKAKAKENKIIIENIINVAKGKGGGGKKKLNERNKGLEYNFTTFLPRQQPNIIQYQQPQPQPPPPPPPTPQSRINNNLEVLIRENERLKQEKLQNELSRPYIEQRNILARKRMEDNENIKKSYMERLPTLPKDYYEEMEQKREVMDNEVSELIEQLNQENKLRTPFPPVEEQTPQRIRRIKLIKRTNNENPL